MTGCAADADDLVQETFVRALSHPPQDAEGDLGPLLVTIALNLARDALRRRKRRAYVGAWLPSPLDESRMVAMAQPRDGDIEARYDLVESVSFAFLVALEALTPTQRAVLVLREVLDYSIEETSKALRLSAANVKVTLHRARKIMAADEGAHRYRPPTHVERETLGRFIEGLLAGDAAAMASALAKDVVSMADGGGEFHANLRPIVGRDRVVRLFLGLSKRRGAPDSSAIRIVGGALAIVASWRTPSERDAPRSVVLFSFDAEGLIRRVDTLLASQKLTAVRFDRSEDG